MSNQIEFRHLRYFVALAKELHFKKAADKLYISQPGLSRQIQQLEGYVGTTLFERDKKHVELTEAGNYFLIESNFLLNALDKMISETNIIASGKNGDIKIGFLGSAMQEIIPNLILKVNKKYPGISFTFEEMSNSLQVEKLISNEIDLGFVRLDNTDSELNLVPIFEDTFSLVLPFDHPIDSTNFKSMKQFKNDSFILFQQSYSPAYYRQIVSICEDNGFLPKIVHNSVHASTIFRLVENNLGISIVPTSLQKGFNLKIKFIELKSIKQRALLSYAWSKKNRNPALKNVLASIGDKMIK